MTIEKKKTYIYADYEKLPEGAPYQLINGMLVKSPPPIPYHQGLIGKLHIYFYELEKKGKGKVYFSPIDVRFCDTEAYQPDLIFISAENLKLIGAKKIEGAPDIAVEVLSPSNAYYDLKHKKKTYEKFGVKEYWIVDPMDSSVEIFINGKGVFSTFAYSEQRGLIASHLYPELKIELDAFFKE